RDRVDDINNREAAMGDDETADGRANHRSNLKNAIVPGDGVRKRVPRHQRWKERTARRPRKSPRHAADKKEQINDRDRSIVEMESTLMPFEHIRDRTESVITRAQDRHLRDGEMLPGNKR